MTDGGAPFQPGTEEVAVPFRPRGSYAGYRAFGSGDGAVLVKPETARELRSAAEFATQERRITGGLLYGRGFADEQGAYLVIDGYLEAGPGENSGDRISADGADRFTLSAADLRLLREDGARMYSASLEAGLVAYPRRAGRVRPAGLRDAGRAGRTRRRRPARVRLRDPLGHRLPGTGRPRRRLSRDARRGGARPRPAACPDPGGRTRVGPELVDLAAGETLTQEPPPAGAGPAATAAPRRRRVRRSAAAPVRTVVTRRWVSRPARADYPGPETPADVQLVVGGLMAVTIAAAIIIGVLVHSVIVAVIIGAVGLLAILSTVKMSRR